MPDTSPRPNPSTGDNPENVLYSKWQATTDKASREEVECEMLPYLRRHATKVCWIVLHSYQPHLVEEIAQDAILELARFEGRSLFSTWFHARAYFRTRLEFRRLRIRKEQSLETSSCATMLNPASSNIEASALVQDIITKLTEDEQRFVDLKVNHGLTDEELAVELGMSRSWVQNTWNSLRGKLRTMYGRNAR